MEERAINPKPEESKEDKARRLAILDANLADVAKRTMLRVRMGC